MNVVLERSKAKGALEISADYGPRSLRLASLIGHTLHKLSYLFSDSSLAVRSCHRAESWFFAPFFVVSVGWAPPLRSEPSFFRFLRPSVIEKRGRLRTLSFISARVRKLAGRLLILLVEKLWSKIGSGRNLVVYATISHISLMHNPSSYIDHY